jgi:HK97 family phage major capsid protein
MISISAPTYEFIVHNFSGDSGAPTPVAEGAPKPEYTPAATSSVVTAIKLAMHTGISYETLADWPQWLAYVQTECFRQIMDLENSQLLSGLGTGAGDLRVPPAMCARRLPRPS